MPAGPFLYFDTIGVGKTRGAGQIALRPFESVAFEVERVKMENYVLRRVPLSQPQHFPTCLLS